MEFVINAKENKLLTLNPFESQTTKKCHYFLFLRKNKKKILSLSLLRNYNLDSLDDYIIIIIYNKKLNLFLSKTYIEAKMYYLFFII